MSHVRVMNDLQGPVQCLDLNTRIDRLSAWAYRIPTETPESDGTLTWDATTMVLVEVSAAGQTGIGYTYSDASAADVCRRVLGPAVSGQDAMQIPSCWQAMRLAVRNMGRSGIAATAISAVDVALWDLKGRLLGVSLSDLIGLSRSSIPAYASGGFTSQTPDELRTQLGGWAAEGYAMVKMKVGRDPETDVGRVRAAREAIGPEVALFVDANGAYSRKQALSLAESFGEQGVCYFEEPVSSDDREGLAMLRNRVPARMDIAAGEYAFDEFDMLQLLRDGAVDLLQADATRCLGISGFLRAGVLAETFQVPLSAHCAPSLHSPLCCAVVGAVHAEDFFDHARIETRVFEGAPRPDRGVLRPDRTRPGLGLEFRRADAEPFAI
ncbi:enolase C-terminal domain-like protein [Tautonia marina]|uniref:enolase C-terminal domain-like protein n=1 Tax=Tautonia marina TaxID=2653855 RepID=UPI00191C6479|nr:enolase C-terminal domain-like protein [Tautonia marina]